MLMSSVVGIVLPLLLRKEHHEVRRVVINQSAREITSFPPRVSKMDEEICPVAIFHVSKRFFLQHLTLLVIPSLKSSLPLTSAMLLLNRFPSSLSGLPSLKYCCLSLCLPLKGPWFSRFAQHSLILHLLLPVQSQINLLGIFHLSVHRNKRARTSIYFTVFLFFLVWFCVCVFIFGFVLGFFWLTHGM